jgi:alpha-glucosidase
VAEIYRDGDNADYRDDKRRFDIVIEKRNVTSLDTIKMVLAPGGGQAIRLVPVK